MKKNKSHIFLTLVSLILFGCFSNNKDSREQIIELLETNGGCELPCFWGIIPGETNLKDVQEILGEVNILEGGQTFYQDGNYSTYLVGFSLDEERRYSQFSIVSTIGEGKIQRIVIGATTTYGGSIKIVPAYFQEYSIEKIFKQIGKPDSILIYVSPTKQVYRFDILLVYEDEKIAINFVGENLPNNDQICPKIGDYGEIWSIDISIANPNSDLDIFPPNEFGPPYTDASHWSSIKDVLGIDEKEFYEKILFENISCFDLITH